MSEETFTEYEVPGVGTVLRHEAGHYVVRRADGAVVSYPAAGEPSEATAAADIAAAMATPAPAPVPIEVSPWQIRRAINAAGLRAAVESAVAAADQDTRDGWEFATTIRRDNALLVGLSSQLGLSSAQVDDLFRSAASAV